MQLHLLKGYGQFQDNEGKTIKYPINKLIIGNSAGEYIEIKIDKISQKLLPYIFELKDSGQLTHDEQGNEVSIIYLHDKNNSNSKTIMVE